MARKVIVTTRVNGPDTEPPSDLMLGLVADVAVLREAQGRTEETLKKQDAVLARLLELTTRWSNTIRVGAMIVSSISGISAIIMVTITIIKYFYR